MTTLKNNILLFVLICLSACISSCGNKENNTTATPPADSIAKEEDPWAGIEDENDPYRGFSLDKKLDALSDSIDIQWYAWNKRDEEKISNIASLFKEVEKSAKRNKTLVDSIKAMHQIAISKKLTMETMLLPNRIDEYDNNMTSLMEKIGRLMQEPPASKSKYCDELYGSIKYSDELEFSIRKSYDGNVFVFNELLEKEKANIEKLGGKYKDLKKLPVFAIMQ
jgi:hypothetical protein